MGVNRTIFLFLFELVVAVVAAPAPAAAASTPSTIPEAPPPLHTKPLEKLVYAFQHGSGGDLTGLHDGSVGNESAESATPSMSDLGGSDAEHGAVIAGLSIAVTTLIAAVVFFCYHLRKSKPSAPASPPPLKTFAGTQAQTYEYKNRPLPPLPVVFASEKYVYGQGYDHEHAVSLAEVKALFPAVKDSRRSGGWVEEWVGRHARTNAQTRLDAGGGMRSPSTPPAFRQHPGALVSFARTPGKW